MNATEPPRTLGAEPDLIGRICDAILCQSYCFQGKSEEMANVMHLCVAGSWHRLNIDGGVVFWKTSPRSPSPWAAEKEGFDYRLIDVSGPSGLINVVIKGCDTNFTSTGATVAVAFSGGRRLIVENLDDRSTYRIE